MSTTSPFRKRRHSLRKQLWWRNPHCTYCGRALKLWQATLDHVLPASKGGTWRKDNLLLACKACNLLKSGLPRSDFVDKVERGRITLPRTAPIQSALPRYQGEGRWKL